MNLVFLSLFTGMIEPYFEHSILKKAKDKNLINIYTFNIRDFSKNKHLKVDSPQIGGGAGMVLECEAMFSCLNYVLEKFPASHIITPSPCAKDFKQKDAIRLSKKENIIFICPRYEGLDERIIEKYVNELFNIGSFILTGGEIASLLMSDAIIRNIKGVLGNNESLKNESYENDLLAPPVFTKPVKYKNLYAIKEFSKGNHAIISKMKYALSVERTKYYKPNLIFLKEKNEK